MNVLLTIQDHLRNLLWISHKDEINLPLNDAIHNYPKKILSGILKSDDDTEPSTQN